MGAENPNQQLPQGPEQKEWQGQRWEYLSFRFDGGPGLLDLSLLQRFGKVSYNHALSMYEDDLLEIARGLKEKKMGNGKEVRESDLLSLLGNNGWELVGVTFQEYGWTESYYFKRPLPPSE